MLGANSYSRRGRFVPSAPANPTTSSSNTLLVRPRLPLRSYIRPKTTSNTLGIDSTSYGRSKRLKSRKLNGYQKIDGTKKKTPDYTEVAYREAVSKLKYLLAESYTPKLTPRKLLHGGGRYLDSNPRINVESGDDTDERSVFSDVSQSKGLIGNLPPTSSPYLPRSKTSRFSKGCSNLALLAKDPQSAPPELMSFIERQEEYIEQLERESRFSRDELGNLLGKVREIVAENEALNEQKKEGLLKSVMEEYGNSEEENQEPNDHEYRTNSLDSKGKRVKLQRVLEGPNIVFESRISELEAQLKQARIELRKARDENQANLTRFSENGTGDCGPEFKAQLEKALRERRECESKVEELQRNLSALRDRESDTAHKAKRALDILEQAQFEKTQAEAEMRRLRDELERQHERLRDATHETSRRVAEERHQLERRYGQQMEQLSADVASHWDAASKSQLETEKQRREMSELRRDLAQKQTHIDELKKELQSKISSMQSDLNQAIAEKDAAEQEVAAARLSTERAERQARQEQNRLQSEITSYRQRLERADSDLVHCRRENLRLSEQIASLEKEININKMVHAEDHTAAVTPRGENDKELTSMILDLESKHATTVAGLEGALANQAALVSQLTTDCQSLTQRLEANDLKHKEEMANLQDDVKFLTTRIQDSLAQQIEHPKPSFATADYSGSKISHPIRMPESQDFPVSMEQPRPSDTTGAMRTSPNDADDKISIDDQLSSSRVTATRQPDNRTIETLEDQDRYFSNNDDYSPSKEETREYVPEPKEHDETEIRQPENEVRVTRQSDERADDPLAEPDRLYSNEDGYSPNEGETRNYESELETNYGLETQQLSDRGDAMQEPIRHESEQLTEQERHDDGYLPREEDSRKYEPETEESYGPDAQEPSNRVTAPWQSDVNDSEALAEQERQFSNNDAYLPSKGETQNYVPEMGEQYGLEPGYDQTMDVRSHEAQEQGNYPHESTEGYAMENYPVDDQHYQPEYTDQDYEQYNQYNQEQYQQEQYEGADPYQNQEMYQQQGEQLGQEYQEYPSNYEAQPEEIPLSENPANMAGQPGKVDDLAPSDNITTQ